MEALMMDWLIAVAMLAVATGAAMETGVKPTLHQIRGQFLTDPKTGKVNGVYDFLVRGCALGVAAISAWPMRIDLDLFGVVFRRYELHPMVGAIPAILAAVFVGRQINEIVTRKGWVKNVPQK